MKMWNFAKRCRKEILRDPLSLIFGLGFPLVLLLLLSAIQSHLPIALFEPQKLTPGVSVFGLSFLTLFSATLLSKDRESSFLRRLYTTPMKASDFILGYTLPLLPMALAQTIICYAFSLLFGLKISFSLLWAILLNLPTALFHIALGLFFGSLLNDKQVGGICGALLTNLSGWLSGTWFDLELVGGAFQKIAQCLPFYHAVELGRAVLSQSFSQVLPHLLWVIGYLIVFLILAILLFLHKMKTE
jgi:ABC-2 type transport system permease protein